MIDSHCHLADEAFLPDLEEVISRAQAAGVAAAVMILAAGNETEAARGRRARELWPAVQVATGIHPHQAGEHAGGVEEAVEIVRRAVTQHQAVAVGEIGLDYHYDFAPRGVQQDIFRRQVALAVELDLPIVIHTREATDDTFAILQESGGGRSRGIFHCFTGDAAMARAALDIGFYVSIAGIVTFPRAAELRDVAKLVPADRLLIETDAPYLAPVPHRGKRNEPAFVVRTAETLAEVRQAAVQELAGQLAGNFETVFGVRRESAALPRLSALTLSRKLQYRESVDQPTKSPLSDTAQNSPVSDLAQIFEPIRDDLEAVEREFVRHIQSRVALIPEMGRYIQNSGGKRVRPAVLLMASRLSGYTGDRAVLYASVVEFIHTATLVHDDIIDGADLRRGRLAVHSRWGNDITVLLGDYLYIKSMAMALTQDSLEIIRLLCDVTLRMIEGELYQLTKAGDVEISEEEHFEIIRRKTAFLFGGCAQIGGMLGGVTPDRETALREYGFNLGLAFQIVDDMLDYTADAAALGKPIGGDLREGKVTLPIIFLRDRGGERADGLIRTIVNDRTVTQEQWREVLHLLQEHRALELAYERAVEYADRAKACLAAFPPTRERDALLALPDYVLSRDR